MEIHHIDCLKYLKTVESQFDLVIADPPYFEICGDFDFVFPSVDHYIGWCQEWIIACNRALKPHGSMYLWGKMGYGKGFALPRLAQWVEDAGYFRIINWITQKNSRGRGTKRGFMEAREELLLLAKSKEYTWNCAYTEERSVRKDLGFDGKPRKNEYKRASDVWTDITEASQSSHQRFSLPNGKLFPTVKPLKGCRRIIGASSNPGDWVYIPFGGVGSEAVACQEMGRNFVLTEINADCIAICKERLNDKN